MSIQLEVQRLENAKSSIAAAIEAKGVTVPPTAKIDTYGNYVSQIPALGGEGTFSPCSLVDYFDMLSDIQLNETKALGAFYVRLDTSIFEPGTYLETIIPVYGIFPETGYPSVFGYSSVLYLEKPLAIPPKGERDSIFMFEGSYDVYFLHMGKIGSGYLMEVLVMADGTIEYYPYSGMSKDNLVLIPYKYNIPT